MLFSCASTITNLALKSGGIFDTESTLKTLTNKKQKVIFIGMQHIGKNEFYDDVSIKIDSLQKQGYISFYESVSDDKEIDSLITKRSAMKLRKLMGYIPIKHLDTTNNIIGAKIKYKGKHKLVNQPTYSELNVDSLKSVRADIGITELITEFEKNDSTIQLDSCDFKFRLNDKKYNCAKVNKSLLKDFMKNYVFDYRNKYLAKKIIQSKNNKVLVIYGKKHFKGLLNELKLRDENWELTK